MDASTLYPPGGLILVSCPKFLQASPAVVEAREYASWLSRGCLDPMALPVWTRKAVIAYLTSHERGTWDRIEKNRKANDRTAVI